MFLDILNYFSLFQNKYKINVAKILKILHLLKNFIFETDSLGNKEALLLLYQEKLCMKNSLQPGYNTIKKWIFLLYILEANLNYPKKVQEFYTRFLHYYSSRLNRPCSQHTLQADYSQNYTLSQPKYDLNQNYKGYIPPQTILIQYKNHHHYTKTQ